MATYTPDKWIILGDGKDFWVFGSWGGGYLDGDSWRRSSGLKSVEEDDKGFLKMHNHSGSIYEGHKNNEGVMTSYCQGILNRMIETTNEHHEKEGTGKVFKVYTLEEYRKITDS